MATAQSTMGALGGKISGSRESSPTIANSKSTLAGGMQDSLTRAMGYVYSMNSEVDRLERSFHGAHNATVKYTGDMAPPAPYDDVIGAEGIAQTLRYLEGALMELNERLHTFSRPLS